MYSMPKLSTYLVTARLCSAKTRQYVRVNHDCWTKPVTTNQLPLRLLVVRMSSSASPFGLKWATSSSMSLVRPDHTPTGYKLLPLVVRQELFISPGRFIDVTIIFIINWKCNELINIMHYYELLLLLFLFQNQQQLTDHFNTVKRSITIYRQV